MKRETVKDAWLKGMESASTKRLATENPYPKGTMLYETWLMGWRKGATAQVDQDRHYSAQGA